MYQVPGSDIVFACIMCAIAMVMCFMFGRIHKMSEIKEELEDFKANRTWLCHEWKKAEDALDSTREAWTDSVETINALWAEHFELERKGLVKKQREAMKKYRAKCDRQVVHHMETYTANQMLAASKFDRPDMSALLSK